MKQIKVIYIMILLLVVNGCALSLRGAARENDVSKIEVLLQRGYRIDETYADDFGFGYTPLHYAAANGSIKATELLLARGADINARGKIGITPLHAACGLLTPIRPGEGSSEAAIYLINRGGDVSTTDGFGLTPIHYAAAHGRLDVINVLLNKGIDINAGNKIVGTPLHYAFPHANPLQKYSLTTAEFLLKEGADINAATASGETPLHRVARMGNCEWVKFLIEHGADVNQPAKSGETPLSIIKQNCPEAIP
jgi:ankyrin